MKRRSLLAGFAALLVAPAAVAKAVAAKPVWRHVGYGHSNEEILRLALENRAADYAELISNSNALLDHMKGNGAFKINHDPSPVWNNSSNG